MSKHAPDVSLVIEWSPRGIVTYEPGTRAVRAFDSLADAAQTINSRNALVAVSRRSVFIRTTHVPNAAPSEIELIVRMKLGELFPLPAHELAYTIDLTDEITPEGRLAVVVAMPAVELRRLHEEMKAAGIRVQRVVPVAYGSAGLASTLGLQNFAVVSKEESGLGIDIVSGGTLRYSRVAAMTATPSAEVCRTYTVAGLPCADIVATPGVSVEDADVASNVAPLEALAGIWPSKVPTLELPEAVALKVAKATAGRRRLAGMLLLAGVLLSLVAYFDYADRLAEVKKQEAKGAAALTKAEREKKSAETAANDITKVEGVVRTAFEPGQKLSDAVSVAANAAPQGVWLTGITLERGKQLLLRGTAMRSEDVAEYMRRLNLASAPVTSEDGAAVAPRFRDVTLGGSSTGKIEDTPVVQFSITAFPVGNIPALDTSKKKGSTTKK